MKDLSKVNRIGKSRHLAYLLRHELADAKGGWVKVNVLVNEYHFTKEELWDIVMNDDKGRYQFSEDGTSVRALYGHSIDVDLELESTTPPTILYHGTSLKSYESIMKDGLKPRKRNFVHLSETSDMAIHVGSLHGVPVILSIDTIAMQKDGYDFYEVGNGVWLTDAVEVKYILFDKK